ncbi:hypothetical protein N9933_00880 [bacterium]|nr:hypothetical protein [bacterium]
MKNSIIYLSFLLFVFLQSCETCEFTEITESVTPVTCDGTFFAMRINTNTTGKIAGYFFDSLSKSIPTPFSSGQLEEFPQTIFSNDHFPSDFSAFDPVHKTYAFATQYENFGSRPLFVADLAPYDAGLRIAQSSFAAPVFLNGKLYAIQAGGEPPRIQYTVVEIDLQTGMTTSLFSEMVTANSLFMNQAMTSASNHSDEIYFLSATNLITYTPGTSTATYTDIDVSHNVNNQVIYYGLEYQQSEKQLLAIKGILQSPVPVSELVSISLDGTQQVTPIIDIQKNLGSENDGEISPEFYSTTFSQCDDVYYISELVEIEPAGGILESFIIEVDLEEMTLRENRVEGYYYGLEVAERE